MTVRTIDQKSISQDSIWRRASRDIRLLLRFGGMIWVYFTTGGRLRRTYRAKEARGETLWIDGDQ